MKKNILIGCACALLFLGSTPLLAQTGALRGGKLSLSNGSNTVTLAAPSGLLESYSLTLPPAQGSTGYFLSVNNGVMGWTSPIEANSAGGLKIGPSTPQITTSSSTYLFDVEYAAGSAGNLPGVILTSEINNPNPDVGALHVVAKNTNASASGVTVKGIVVNVSDSGTGTQTGIRCGARGNGTNYAMILSGTSGTLCGMGTTTPTENLEVSGNLRISGKKGLKISEWADPGAGAATAGTMGVVTLSSGSKVVKTSSVTANSRIFLTTQTASNPGQIYISARTAGTSFTISSRNILDASTVAWVIIEP